jgi:hypothetical protein
MFNLNQLQIANQHRRDMEKQAENWRITQHKDSYEPNRALRRKRRK